MISSSHLVFGSVRFSVHFHLLTILLLPKAPVIPTRKRNETERKLASSALWKTSNVIAVWPRRCRQYGTSLTKLQLQSFLGNKEERVMGLNNVRKGISLETKKRLIQWFVLYEYPFITWTSQLNATKWTHVWKWVVGWGGSGSWSTTTPNWDCPTLSFKEVPESFDFLSKTTGKKKEWNWRQVGRRRPQPKDPATQRSLGMNQRYLIPPTITAMTASAFVYVSTFSSLVTTTMAVRTATTSHFVRKLTVVLLPSNSLGWQTVWSISIAISFTSVTFTIQLFSDLTMFLSLLL